VQNRSQINEDNRSSVDVKLVEFPGTKGGGMA